MLRKVFLFLLLSVSFIAHGQHLARVCVIDMARVYQESQRESRGMRDLQDRTLAVQNEIDRRQNAINELRVRHSTAIADGNQNEANRLETQINRQTESLRDYHQAQTAILQRQMETLMQSNSFLNQVQNEIRLVAEGEGYSIVIDRSNRNSGIMWNSSTVDITDRVIQNLRNRSR